MASGPSKPAKPPRLHHIGFVTADGDGAARLMAGLGLPIHAPGRVDPIQKVKATFVDLTGSEEVFLEILEPAAEDSPIQNLVEQGGGLHHLCFEVDDIRAACRDLESQGFKRITGPVECSGFDHTFPGSGTEKTQIAFWLLPIRLLIELVQRP